MLALTFKKFILYGDSIDSYLNDTKMRLHKKLKYYLKLAYLFWRLIIISIICILNDKEYVLALGDITHYMYDPISISRLNLLATIFLLWIYGFCFENLSGRKTSMVIFFNDFIKDNLFFNLSYGKRRKFEKSSDYFMKYFMEPVSNFTLYFFYMAMIILAYLAYEDKNYNYPFIIILIHLIDWILYFNIGWSIIHFAMCFFYFTILYLKLAFDDIILDLLEAIKYKNSTKMMNFLENHNHIVIVINKTSPFINNLIGAINYVFGPMMVIYMNILIDKNTPLFAKIVFGAQLGVQLFVAYLVGSKVGWINHKNRELVKHMNPIFCNWHRHNNKRKHNINLLLKLENFSFTCNNNFLGYKCWVIFYFTSLSFYNFYSKLFFNYFNLITFQGLEIFN